ncbi:MAG: hypothetical protein SV775_04035 [Thermodesulfobacteriota bacterium]|nr:hypothetical protein [Thermodesulfobacteriota bacterium]
MSSRLIFPDANSREKTEVDFQQEDRVKTVQERMAEEDLVKSLIDKEGNRWTKVYFGGGHHFKNWLEQCKELGEVMVEEVDATGYKCFEDGGEKAYRIWMKMEEIKEDDLF